MFPERNLQPGYGCAINMGLPDTMKLQRRRPSSFHIAQYAQYQEGQRKNNRLETLSFAFNPIGGLPGTRRRVVITHPIYSAKPHHLQFNPVCHIAKNGVRSLRLVEWSSGEYVKHIKHDDVRIWEMDEAKLNRKDPRWVSRLQSLGMWPAVNSSKKAVQMEGLSSNLEVHVIQFHVCTCSTSVS